ncbi:MAG: MarR family transcriptional regulator [Planctomycetes bacterium]|nr:MarR family transcriptional regulator [Planctomycetota bacterium]
MSLKEELNLKKPIALLPHEAMLNIYYTATAIRKDITDFLRKFKLTDVQFNVLMLLKHHCDDNGGLSQGQISRMMLVNKANITSLIDRMEKGQLVKRTAADDRRYNIVMTTARGKKLLEKVEPLYGKEVTRIMTCLNQTEQKKLIKNMEKVRNGINA